MTDKNFDNCAGRCEDCPLVESCIEARGNPDCPYYNESEDPE